MALTTLVCNDLVQHLQPGQRIASLGYPDIVAPEVEVDKWLGREVIKYRDDSDKICKWHGIKPQRIPDSRSFFDAFECNLDVFDIYKARGDEIILDLNRTWDGSKYAENYDYVLDVGTLEHCFNIGQAAKNAVSLLKVGGIIYHSNPFIMGNHGFYGLNPTWFADFYGQRGFELIWCKLMEKGGIEAIDAPKTQRFNHGTDRELNIFAAAKRIEIRNIVYPVQTKYVALAAAGNRA
jgi:hypothetical protein